MMEFGGWEMPLAYPPGILEEHLSTLRYGAIFDISHMGRFRIAGRDAVPFLQMLLTNNVLALAPGMAQYTLLANETGGAVDDAYLYRLQDGEGWGTSGYLLVVNAANRQKDWEWLQDHRRKYADLVLEDQTEEIAMIALQGPRSKSVLIKVLREGRKGLPEPWRNHLRLSWVEGCPIVLCRTGYTGEPICFEMFLPRERVREVWEKIIAVGEEEGIVPAGLGARDTLRLEAGLPLYGRELGLDREGKEIPVLAVPSCRAAVSFSPLKGDFVGREALKAQWEELRSRMQGDGYLPLAPTLLYRKVMPMAILDRGVARSEAEVWSNGTLLGYVTSGTMVPFWRFTEEGVLSHPSRERGMRAIALAYLDWCLKPGQEVEVRQRGKSLRGLLVKRHLAREAPPFARPILAVSPIPQLKDRHHRGEGGLQRAAARLWERTLANTRWRQSAAINLIPSEQTPSPLVRLLSIADPVGRYAEHRPLPVLGSREIYYYQGTGLIEEVESLLIQELRSYLGCSEVEVRAISGQMANMVVFGGLLDYLNRNDGREEARRIRKVLNHHLGRGGHLSAQYLGALRDFVAFDPVTERPAVVHFPVEADNPYRLDLKRTAEVIERHRPELIILGKSMILHPEPVKEIVGMASTLRPRPIVLYDTAHVLGLIGPYFQDPFAEGADLVTASTHKTFFGTQRGIVGSNMAEGTEYEELWKAICRRTFPGSVSNHHLGTLLGLLLAAYEMNQYRHHYQRAVIANAKAFARSLRERGLAVEGDPEVGYTETHQVIVRVGFGEGPKMAHLLEENNIIVNYQAAPDDEGFTAASCLRMGVQEMTRFGLGEADFAQVADYIGQVILDGHSVAEEVQRFRSRFTEMRYCLSRQEASTWIAAMEEILGGM
jgi:aminomethyltransferase